jgi:hypothetical protein
MTYQCPICNRDEGGEMQYHHLKPVTFRTRTKEVHDEDNLVLLHKQCHSKIHATFSEGELLKHYHTIDRLLEHEEIQKFVKWIQKYPPEFYSKNKQTNERKRKRKR